MSQGAEEFLGGPLRDARVEVRLTTYVREDYTSNGCALVEVNDSDGTSTMHVGSLRGTMAKNRPMAITCGRMDDEVMVYLECTEPHSAEYAGAVLDGGQPEVSCRKVVTDYLGLSADEFDRRGDLAVRWLGKARDGGLTGCVVAEAKERGALTGSVKGLKSAALPVT